MGRSSHMRAKVTKCDQVCGGGVGGGGVGESALVCGGQESLNMNMWVCVACACACSL